MLLDSEKVFEFKVKHLGEGESLAAWGNMSLLIPMKDLPIVVTNRIPTRDFPIHSALLVVERQAKVIQKLERYFKHQEDKS